jgi:predicted nucleic acid-binding Zn ribbon protein
MKISITRNDIEQGIVEARSGGCAICGKPNKGKYILTCSEECAEAAMYGIPKQPRGKAMKIDEAVERILAAIGHKQEILPNAVYCREEVVEITGFSVSTVIRAENKGKLNARHVCERPHYMGSDVLEWLAGKKKK